MSRQAAQPPITMTPPQGEAIAAAHPRRPPAHRSVSLLHSPRSRQRAFQKESDESSSNDSNQAQMRTNLRRKQSSDSPTSINPLNTKHSSGESSNAEKWFEKSNNEVREQAALYPNEDPPYFLRNSSSSEEHAEGQRSAQLYYRNDTGSLPMRTNLLHLGTDGSSTEDFRSVIDDLTIENKKLKRRLKKYEKLQDSHLRDEKLFEVRVHGLSAEKKRELEETLRKFASDMHAPKAGAEFPANGYSGLGSLLHTHKTASSSTSLHNADSAYASMSVSGQGSGASDTRRGPFAPSAKSRHQNIHTYLHHIPEGLLPNSNPGAMTERAKKKLVARRLEQIFAGKGATATGHQQALQQQDVSHMAARADRRAREAEGQQWNREGVREANMLEQSAEDIAVKQDDSKAGDASHSKTAATEQRPTRPLDLDPHRAQIPADNMRYIRHLGFTLPDPNQSPEDDQGWVYLNLLINMAQLHTINVTTEFVRKAIGDHSDKLEISEDGRKVRWRGGSSITRSSSTAGDESTHRTDEDNSSQSPRKRVKLSRMDSDREHNGALQKQGIASAARSAQESRFAYTPLFFHKDSTGDEDSSSEMEDDDDMSSPFPQIIGGDSSGMTSSGVRTTSTKNKKKHDDGPIIFYNNARFCTDLSGDRKPAAPQRDGPIYKAASISPIGKPTPRIVEKFFEERGPLAAANDLPEPMDLADNPIPDNLELAFPPSTSPSADSGKLGRSPVKFEVTGIGGVYPADNFAIAVETRHARIVEQAHPSRAKVLPPKLAKILGHSESEKTPAPKVERTIVVQRKDLEPSELPPALLYMQSDSISDDDSDIDDNASLSPESPGAMPRLAAPQPMDVLFGNDEDSDAEMDYDEDDDDDESDDGSLDLLAAARALDPEAVRAREREYDANMAERLAEEIPAGSSAATAGGGSGFASPASGVSKAAYYKARKEARSRGPSVMPRASTGDSVAVRRSSSMASEDGEDGSVRS